MLLPALHLPYYIFVNSILISFKYPILLLYSVFFHCEDDMRCTSHQKMQNSNKRAPGDKLDELKVT